MDRFTEVTIRVLGRVSDPDGFVDFCAAVDHDLERPLGTTLAQSVPACLDDGRAFHIQADAVDYGFVEKTKEAAVRNQIDIIVSCGPAEEHLGTIYAVRAGVVSPTLSYDPAHDRILVDAQTLRDLECKGLDRVRDVGNFLARYGEASFDPFFLEQPVYEMACGTSSVPRP